MKKYECSKHAQRMMAVREISETWVEETLDSPEWTENKEDGTIHFIKSISAFGNRRLRVVVNCDTEPQRIVTVYFDRKLGVKL